MYDVIIIGAGPGGIFSAYELMKKKQELKIASDFLISLNLNAVKF